MFTVVDPRLVTIKLGWEDLPWIPTISLKYFKNAYFSIKYVLISHYGHLHV